MRTAVLFVLLVVAPSCDRAAYRHVTAAVERVDEPEDALEVYHDRVRGATCYAKHDGVEVLSCIPDVWLTKDASR